MPFKDDDADDLRLPIEGMPEPVEGLEQRPDRGEVRTREVKVVGVWEHVPQNYFEVVLRDSMDRDLHILIGLFEAHAIASYLQGERPVRPMTHDLLKNTIEKLGAKIERLTIDDLFHETYYGKLSLLVGETGIIDVDTRPSDGIAMALRANAPIYVSETVMEEAARRDDESGESEEIEE